MRLVALALALLVQGGDPLERDPAELPRCEPERWVGLFEGRELVMERLPQELGPLVVEAQRAYAAGDYPRAIGLHYRVLDREPDFPPTLLELGATYFRLRRYSDAAAALERFLEVAPGQVFRTQALAHSYYSLGRYREALEHYERVLADEPGSVEAVRGRALSLYRLGEIDAALEALERALELREDHTESLTWKAQILYEEGRSEEALPAAEEARDLDPYTPGIWYLLAQILRDLGREEEADAAREEWAELDRLVQEARSLEGQLLHRPGDFSLAMRLVGVQREIGDAAAVRSSLARALRARPEEVREVDLRILALDTLFDMGDAEGAKRAAGELARFCADSAEAWKRLELYFARIGDVENQVRAGERYLRLSAGE